MTVSAKSRKNTATLPLLMSPDNVLICRIRRRLTVYLQGPKSMRDHLFAGLAACLPSEAIILKYITRKKEKNKVNSPFRYLTRDMMIIKNNKNQKGNKGKTKECRNTSRKF